MIQTKYICDKCGNVADTDTQFWTVGVTAYTSGHVQSHTPPIKDKKIQVCRPCLESLGIHAPKPKEGEPKVTPPTVEELVKEIIQRCTSEEE